MANELTSNELARLYELHDAGSTQKEIANTICGQFGRQTLDRTTIFRRLKLRGTMGLLDSWKVWLNEHEGDAEKAIEQYVAHRRTEAMYLGNVPDAMNRWRLMPHSRKVLIGIRERDRRFLAFEVAFAEAISVGDRKGAQDIADEIEACLLSWIGD